jgi:hypothetical protein
MSAATFDLVDAARVRLPEPGMTPLGGGPWRILSPVVVRTTGLPVAPLIALAAEGADPAADPEVFESELRRTSAVLAAEVAGETFREALAWQNPGALAMADSFAGRVGATDGRRDAKQRKREYRLARYLARYSGKTETIGFFGPVGFAHLTSGPGHIEQRPGTALLGARRTFAEPWAVRALGAGLGEDPAIAPWLPLRLRAHHSVRDGSLYRPRTAPVELTDLEQAVLALCDGHRPRCDVIEAAARGAGVAVDAVEALVADLERRRFLVADANLPLGPDCVSVLRDRLAAIRDPGAAAAAEARTRPFLDCLAALGRAAGDTAAVASAQADLAAAFEQAAGVPSARRAGQTYAGRGLAYEECLRDLDIDLGADFAVRIGERLAGVLAICQWLTWTTAAAYADHFRAAWSAGTRTLDSVWFDVLAAFLGTGPRPMDAVLGEFHVRWGRLIEDLHSATGSWDFGTEQFLTAVQRRFSSPGPGWRAAAVHSPDLQIVAHTPDGADSGDYTVVLGEIHIGVPTITGPVFEWPFDDARTSRFLRDLLGPACVPAFPDTWPRNTGRTAPDEAMPGDLCFAFTDVQGAPDGTVAVTDLTVGVLDGEPVVVLPDGVRVAFAEFFSFFLSATVLDAWKGVTDGPHTPRISVDGLVLTRETWRVDLAGQAFLTTRGEYDSYREVEAWRRALGLPDRVYAKLGSEVKPVYLDFRSPISVLSFLAAARAVPRGTKVPTTVTFSEALPGPDQAWIRDAQGGRYFGEIRMAVLDGRVIER